MLTVIIAGHGPLADALLTSARMIWGALPRTHAVTLEEHGGITAFQQVFTDALTEAVYHSSGVLVLCDLQSGTPFNLACRFAMTPGHPVPVAVVAGVNLPMVLMSAELLEEPDVHQVARRLIAQAREAVSGFRPAVAPQPDLF
ncbi:PTS fructose transporter subunit IIA [Chimaeribacter arupi]|uniref:PTS sugar transporter subunit IIA n=1 Tax=Chimaeribacter arupi TaxID=2060066 RepID=UPI000C7BD3B4|nr:PTS fructose transporter subunit IIA [Chimaeribacter arupi]PLR52037.1 PTS fructose transporter subunit IIA [Chimaeribacter arupi]WKZ92987.1 PTS fructose transporter subunit IIA [Chimaeribacter arupi]